MNMKSPAIDQVQTALAAIIEALKADGYLAEVEITEGDVAMRIMAGPDACADCLSPRAVLEPMILQQLRSNGLSQGLTLVYPQIDGPEPMQP
jgi:hypothetical protein